VKVLVDSCVSGDAAEELRTAGHDAAWAGAWPRDPGDDEILARAYSEGRVLVTLDKDFGEKAVVRGMPHSGIMRLTGLRSVEHGRACVAVLERYGAELAAGALVTVEAGRVRIRPKEGT
jgi:predicted nuclease of predicted toxin-antitoxin system